MMRSIARCRSWALTAIVLVALQAVLPGLHIIIDHCPHAGPATASGSVLQAAGDTEDEGVCSICAMLHATGQVAPPVDDGAPIFQVVPVPWEFTAPAFAWIRCAPDVRSTSPRGPPTA